jgi:hypothetical protein
LDVFPNSVASNHEVSSSVPLYPDIGRGIEADIVVYDGLISSQGFRISHILVLRRLRLFLDGQVERKYFALTNT